jgi:hypothetical protein
VDDSLLFSSLPIRVRAFPICEICVICGSSSKVMRALSIIFILLAIGCADRGGVLDDNVGMPPSNERARNFRIAGNVVDESGTLVAGVEITLEKTKIRMMDDVGDRGYRFTDVMRERQACDGPFVIEQENITILKILFNKDGYAPASLYYTFADANDKSKWWVVVNDVKVVMKKAS